MENWEGAGANEPISEMNVTDGIKVPIFPASLIGLGVSGVGQSQYIKPWWQNKHMLIIS